MPAIREDEGEESLGNDIDLGELENVLRGHCRQLVLQRRNKRPGPLTSSLTAAFSLAIVIAKSPVKAPTSKSTCSV